MNRAALLLVLIASGPAAAWPGLSGGSPTHKPRLVAKTPQHPDRALRAFVEFLYSKVKPEDRPYWEAFTFLTSDEVELADDVTEWLVYLHLTSTGPTVIHPIPLTSDLRVWAFDFREAGQNRQAWHAVARLEPTLRTPHVNPVLAEAVRQGIGVPVDPKTFHCEGVLPAQWFVRQLKETDLQDIDGKTPEDIVYYNLLYARERFGDSKLPPVKSRGPVPEKPKGQPWGGGTWIDGKDYPRGAFTYAPEAEINAYKKALAEWEAAGKGTPVPADGKRGDGFVDRNFPRDLTDFQVKWGIKAVSDFLAAQRFFARNGTIVAGYFNDLKAGSYVAFNNRLLSFQTAGSGDVGLALYMRTQDFKRTSLKRNVVNFPLDAARDNIQEDAGEHIAMTPLGFPVFLLTGGAGDGRKRVESGDPHVVFDKRNGGTLIVQTMGKCVGCHYPTDVVLPPSNDVLLDALKRDNSTKARRLDQQLDIDRFFYDGDDAGDGWKWKLKLWREPFARSLVKVTRSAKNPKGWTGSTFADRSNQSRETYDAPVTLEVAAAELGYPRLVVVFACGLLGNFDAGELLTNSDRGVPRAEWDDELFGQLANVIAFARDLENPSPQAQMFQALFPEFVRDSYTPYKPTTKGADQ